MVFGLKKATVDDLLTIIAAIFLFNTFVKFDIVAKYIEQYRLIIFGLAIVLIIYRNKIADTLGE